MNGKKTFIYMLIDVAVVVVVHFSSNCRLVSHSNTFEHLLSIKFTRANWQSINQVLNHY